MSPHDALRIWNEHFHTEWPSYHSSSYRLKCLIFYVAMGVFCSFLVAWVTGADEWGIFIILLLRIPGALLGIISGMTIIAAIGYIKKRAIIRRFQEKHPDAYLAICEAFAQREFPE